MIKRRGLVQEIEIEEHPSRIVAEELAVVRIVILLCASNGLKWLVRFVMVSEIRMVCFLVIWKSLDTRTSKEK